MYGAWLSGFALFGALLAGGFAIKMMDDALDVDYDICRGRRTLAAKLGKGALPYALLVGLVGTAWNAHVVIAVFLASYTVGMALRLGERLPTRLPAGVEMALAALLSILLVGWMLTLWAIAMMAVIDWLDDVVDVSNDALAGAANMVARIGLIETLLLILCALCIAVLTNAKLTALTFIALPLLTIFFDVVTTRVLHSDDDEVRE